MSNTKSKELPTIREADDNMTIFQRELREVLRRIWDELDSIKARLDALENP